jgi:hypothetical protein
MYFEAVQILYLHLNEIDMNDSELNVFLVNVQTSFS